MFRVIVVRPILEELYVISETGRLSESFAKLCEDMGVSFNYRIETPEGVVLKRGKVEK